MANPGSNPGEDPDQEPGASARGRLCQLARLFLRPRVTAPSGPAAHIAMMHDDAVRRRRCVSDRPFVDLVGPRT